MKDISDELRLDKMRSGNPAVYILRDEFESFLSSPREADRYVRIARCFLQLEQFRDAGNWYQNAGRLILAEPSTPVPLKAMIALNEFEKALECYARVSDEDSVVECSLMIQQLQKACAPA